MLYHKTMKKFLLFTLMTILFFAVGFTAKASHLMGGEITWTYAKAGVDSGKFKFQVKLYRDCNGIPIDSFVTLSTNAITITV